MSIERAEAQRIDEGMFGSPDISAEGTLVDFTAGDDDIERSATSQAGQYRNRTGQTEIRGGQKMIIRIIGQAV